eukprot:1004192_1
MDTVRIGEFDRMMDVRSQLASNVTFCAFAASLGLDILMSFKKVRTTLIQGSRLQAALAHIQRNETTLRQIRDMGAEVRRVGEQGVPEYVAAVMAETIWPGDELDFFTPAAKRVRSVVESPENLEEMGLMADSFEAFFGCIFA